MRNLFIEVSEKNWSKGLVKSFWSYANGEPPVPELFTQRLFYDYPPLLKKLSWDKVEELEAKGLVSVDMYANGLAHGSLAFKTVEALQEALE